MAKIIFWEKPDCKGNGRQKEILLNSGHELEVRNLLREPWTKESLDLFFSDRPVAEWFNKTNPQVKSGTISPDKLTREEALTMLVTEPLLIGRPLMQVGKERMAGFNVELVQAWIGLKKGALDENNPQDCPCGPSQG